MRTASAGSSPACTTVKTTTTTFQGYVWAVAPHSSSGTAWPCSGGARLGRRPLRDGNGYPAERAARSIQRGRKRLFFFFLLDTKGHERWSYHNFLPFPVPLSSFSSRHHRARGLEPPTTISLSSILSGFPYHDTRIITRHYLRHIHGLFFFFYTAIPAATAHYWMFSFGS